jgi:hypothetical protein
MRAVVVAEYRRISRSARESLEGLLQRGGDLANDIQDDFWSDGRF